MSLTTRRSRASTPATKRRLRDLAIAAAVVAGAGIGLFQGFMFDFFGIPSFVVTLAVLLAWQGFQVKVLGNTGTVNLGDPTITGLTGTF